MGQVRDGNTSCRISPVKLLRVRTLLVNGARLDKFASMSADDLTDYLSKLI